MIATTTRKRYKNVAARPCHVSGANPRPPSFLPHQGRRSDLLPASAAGAAAVRINGCLQPRGSHSNTSGGQDNEPLRNSCNRLLDRAIEAVRKSLGKGLNPVTAGRLASR